jgi:hypothetical protein
MSCLITEASVRKSLREDALTYITPALVKAGASVREVDGNIHINPMSPKIFSTTTGLVRSLANKNKFPAGIYIQENYKDGITLKINVPAPLLEAFQKKYGQVDFTAPIPLLEEQDPQVSTKTVEEPNSAVVPAEPIEPEKVPKQSYKVFPEPKTSFVVEKGIQIKSPSEVIYAGEVYASLSEARKAQREDEESQALIQREDIARAVDSIPTLDSGDLNDIGFEETYCGL